MSKTYKIHVTGASCAGVSTLGSALSERFGVPCWDVGDFYWMPTDPPFRVKRPPEDRVHMIRSRQAESAGWVLAGSLVHWGDAAIQNVDLIVFLRTSTAVRLQRLDQREAVRHGNRILEGGDMHESHLAFRQWASQYEDPAFDGRSLILHRKWLAAQQAPVLQLSGESPLAQLVLCVENELARPHRETPAQ